MSNLVSRVNDFERQALAYLQSKIEDAEQYRLVNVERIAVGWSHETWLFDLSFVRHGEQQLLPLCLRRDPGNALLRHLSSLEEQFRVLQCLDSTELPTPKPYWFEPEPNILGAPFLIMEKVPGTCPNPWGKQGRAFYADAATREDLPRSFTETLATLHRLDWQQAGLEFLGVPDSGQAFVAKEIDKWSDLIESSAHAQEPILTDLICWLKENIPASNRRTLVHGAYRTGNLLIHNEKISAVLDWELQVIGDPMYDVSYVLSDLNREGTELLSNLVARDLFCETYERESGLTIDFEACRYYNALYAMRSVAFWMSASGLFAEGASEDLRLARTAWSVPVVLARAARDLGY